MIIGITGTDGAGKGTVVKYLISQGFTHCSARALLLEEITERGLPATRENMCIVANSLRAERGDDYVVQEYLRREEPLAGKRLIIESIRALAEVETLKKHGGILLAVDADQKRRYARIHTRASESDQVTFEEFARQEALEMNDPDPHGMQKGRVIAAADYTLHNEGTLEELHAQIDRVLSEIKK